MEEVGRGVQAANALKGQGKPKGPGQLRLYTAPCGLLERCRPPISFPLFIPRWWEAQVREEG